MNMQDDVLGTVYICVNVGRRDNEAKAWKLLKVSKIRADLWASVINSFCRMIECVF